MFALLTGGRVYLYGKGPSSFGYMVEYLQRVFKRNKGIEFISIEVPTEPFVWKKSLTTVKVTKDSRGLSHTRVCM